MLDEKKADSFAVEKAPSLSQERESITDPKPTDIVPGSESVTHEELQTLRHVRDKFPLSAFLVAIVEFAERYVGLSRPPWSRLISS